MTFAGLQILIQEHNIPLDVKLQSDSGWECDETEMNGVWYNSKTNTIIFTQGNREEFSKYYDNEDWIMLSGCIGGNYKAD